MDIAGKIEPSEVLAHLNQLGYQNISPLQLKEFIRDLKKLIVYDQLSSSSGSLTSLTSSATSDSTYCYTSETTTDQSRALSYGCRRHKPPMTVQNESNRTKDGSMSRCENPCKASTNSGTLLKRRFSSSTSGLSQKCVQKENLPVGKVKTKSMCEEDLREAVKPKTSFIRPWQLQGMASGMGRAGRSDPVSLYHYYQTLWAQHKCPGEDSHADLRWVIREKMLGQDPHLYSQNVASAAKKKYRLRV